MAGPTMIFVVGARRSGTRWVERILGASPEVAVVPVESHLISHGVESIFAGAQHAVPASPQVGAFFIERPVLIDHVRRLCDAVYEGYRARVAPDATHVLDRSPWHVHALARIGEIYPDAIVVHVIRDGRDVVRSLLAQPWGPDDAGEAADEWRRAIDDARSARHAVGTYIEVRYEALIDDAAAEIDRLYRAVGLPADGADLERALEAAGALANMHPDDVAVRRAKWQSMPPQALATVYEVAGDRLRSLGYGVGPVLQPPSAQALPTPRDVAGRIAARVRSMVPVLAQGTPSPAPPDPFALVHFLSDVESGQLERAAEAISPDFELIVSGGGPRIERHGHAALAALRDRLADAGAVIDGGVLDGADHLVVVTQRRSSRDRSSVVVLVATTRGGHLARLTVQCVSANPPLVESSG